MTSDSTVLLSSNTYVAVCGPLASGKTTLANALAQRYGWNTILEDLSTHPYLAAYYADKKRWAFHTVIEFITRGFQSQERVRELLSDTCVCQDWYVGEHVGVYGRLVHDEGTIDHRELTTCWALHEALMSVAVRPDLVVYLSATPSTLLRRTKKRARGGEAEGITIEYVERLVGIYQEWVSGVGPPILEIDTEAADFARTTAGVRDSVELVGAKLRAMRMSDAGA